MPAVDGIDQAVRYRAYPMLTISYSRSDGSIANTRLNEKGYVAIKEYGDRFYPMVDPVSKIVGLMAQPNGTVVLHENNKRLTGIGRLLSKLRDEDDINRFIVVKTEDWFKKLHGIDILLVPFSADLSLQAKYGDFGAIVSKHHIPEPEEITVPELPEAFLTGIKKKK